MNPLY